MSRQLNRDAGARCSRCGSSFGHLRGCSLEDLTLLPTQETNIRHNPEDVSAFDVDCLLHEIDYLRTELKESQWLTKNAVDELANLKEIHAACELEIHLRAVTIREKNAELIIAKEQLNEAHRMWNASLEVQAEFEKEDLGLRERMKGRILQLKQRHGDISEHEPDMRAIGRLEGNIGALEWALREMERPRE